MAPRVLMYSQDGFGLGHFRRSENIARAVLGYQPQAQVLVLADSPAPPFASTPRIDYVKLPTVVKSTHAHWQTGSLGIDILETMQMRAQLILDVYRSFRPDIVLVDHMPVGALGELKPTLERIVHDPRPAKLFLGLRDVLDAPAVIRQAWGSLGAYDYLSSYDSVLVYGCEDIFDADAAYGLRPSARNVVYCNYVARLGKAVGIDVPPFDARFVLMMGGGGHDAGPLAQAFIDAMSTHAGDRGLEAMVVAGPTMARHEREALLAQNHTAGISIVPSLAETLAWTRQASALVTMGGYNTLCEVVALRKKALVVPRSGPSAEQRIRSQLFADRGLVKMLNPVGLEASRLAAVLDDLLASDSVPCSDNIPALDGADRAARHILGLCPLTRPGEPPIGGACRVDGPQPSVSVRLPTGHDPIDLEASSAPGFVR